MDHFIEQLFSMRYYDVYTETGIVTNLRSGTIVSGAITVNGYRVVSLVFSRHCERQAKVHRMVAVKAFGLAAVRGKQIAHLDGDRLNNTVSNLRPLSAREHITYDHTDRNLTHRAQPKQSWLPCTRCGTTGGETASGRTPDRITGARFGIDGTICRRCYGTLQERQRRMNRGMLPQPERWTDPLACHCDILVALMEGRAPAPPEGAPDAR